NAPGSARSGPYPPRSRLLPEPLRDQATIPVVRRRGRLPIDEKTGSARRGRGRTLRARPRARPHPFPPMVPHPPMVSHRREASMAVILSTDVRHGDRARVVVLLHSLALDRSVWDALLDHLPADLTVVRPDLRGHGASP